MGLLHFGPCVRLARVRADGLFVSVAGELHDVERELAVPALAPIMDHGGQQFLILEGAALV